jgi:Fe-S cluster assembly protein SufB
VPKGVEVPLPLQAYFRINGENTGQFERTLIVVDEGAKVHYIEGCTAPIYATDSLHVAVVEVVALARLQGSLHDHPELVERRLQPRHQARPRVRELARRVDRRQHGLAQDRQVPEHLPARPRRQRGHHQRRGGRQGPAPGHRRQGHPPGPGHEEPRIVSKSSPRTAAAPPTAATLKVAPGATNVVASVRCDALMLDDESRSDTYPYIDIQEDDTTMTHEATVGKISQDQVFYLMSRGLTENEAQNLIVQGFLEVFTKELPMEYAIEFNRLVKLEMEGALG